MILSFHPIIEADRNLICAGREPGAEDLAAIEQAQAVILPQGCSETLYRMARENCAHVFPNLDVRFDFPGKLGQIDLFQREGLAHPATVGFESSEEFTHAPRPAAFPVVIKLDWGGQGHTVFKVNHAGDLEAVLERVRAFEATGQSGFLVQQYIPSGGRSLRVVVIGRYLAAYWRIQSDPGSDPGSDPRSDPGSDPGSETGSEAGRFGASLAQGATIDHDADPDLRASAVDAVRRFCQQTGLQLAGFDFIFDERASGGGEPLALEINYFFGRQGLGGSRAYYRILQQEVDAWLADR